MRRLVFCAAVAAVLVSSVSRPAARSAAPAAAPLTVDTIMRGPALVGYPPGDLRWSADGRDLYFEWRMPGEDEPATWVTGRDGGPPRRLTDEERRVAPLANGWWDGPRQRILGVDRGDVVVIDAAARRRIDITRTSVTESAPRWARGGTHVTFVRDNQVFLVPVTEVGGGAMVQLVDASVRPAAPKLTESQRTARREEEALIDWVEQAAARRARQEARARTHAPLPIELAERQRVVDAVLGAGDAYLWLAVADGTAQARTAQVPRFVSESAYTEEIAARTKVGDAQDGRRLLAVDLASGDAVWAGLDGAVEPRTAPRPLLPTQALMTDPPADDAAAPAATGRDVRWTALLPSPDGRRLVASVRAADNTDRWLVRVDPATGRSTVLDHVHDDAWVREVGQNGSYGGGVGWLPDNRRVWFLAEHDGWMQLSTVDASADVPSRTPITTGRFEIDHVQVTPDGQHFLVQSTEAHPGERQLYSVPVSGGARTRLTTWPGAHAADVSPDGATLGLVSSASNVPPEVHVMPHRAGAERVRVTTSPSAEWRSRTWVEPQLVTYTTRDGQQVAARLYTPEMVGARRNAAKAAVVFVHGAGYLQNAHRYWSSYYREYMFHHLLASKGYVVLDPDYRASAGYGRDWRTAIYRWMGGKDLEDVVDGAAYLARSHGVDARRIGVYGGSYGGFITLMAMFTTPDVFAAGAALRPVTDWAHYNHPYTANILNEPQGDLEAYRKSSPIYFAEGLKGALLICHGMVDVNVHFQDSVRLAQRLIELRKENWELAAYPVEDHGFEYETSWADEYKRILALFDRTLLRK
jgi:dipeptidyl aminopeptidase/acylaminoacyl peptidase